jgi:hypothetical protein
MRPVYAAGARTIDLSATPQAAAFHPHHAPLVKSSLFMILERSPPGGSFLPLQRKKS